MKKILYKLRLMSTSNRELYEEELEAKKELDKLKTQDKFSVHCIWENGFTARSSEETFWVKKGLTNKQALDLIWDDIQGSQHRIWRNDDYDDTIYEAWGGGLICEGHKWDNWLEVRDYVKKGEEKPTDLIPCRYCPVCDRKVSQSTYSGEWRKYGKDDAAMNVRYEGDLKSTMIEDE